MSRTRTPARVALPCALALAACGGPFLVFPGGALSGEVVEEPVRDWSFVDDAFVDLETRPDDPYSVELNYIVRDGSGFAPQATELVIPGRGRQWVSMRQLGFTDHDVSIIWESDRRVAVFGSGGMNSFCSCK